MSLHALDGAAVERLRDALAGTEEVDPTPAPAAPSPEGAAGGLRARARRYAGGAARRALRPARPYVGRALDLLAARVDARARAQPTLVADVERAAIGLELLKGELRALQAFVALGDAGPTAAGSASPLSRLEAVVTNLELLKGDVRALDAALGELGQAIAPAAGLPGVPGRFAELRDRVNALDRRLRHVEVAAPPPSSAPAPGDAAAVEVAPAAAAADRFDYVGFERRFRGDPADVLRTLSDRYLDLLAGSPPVLDVGCGRGELLSALAERGVACSGVDLDAGMVAEARAAGLDVAEGDAVAHLRSLPEGSLGSIIAVHVAEHLHLPALIDLLELAASRLRPGGLLVAETPNPASLVVLGNSYILDPTHVWPLHPSLLTFLCERAGFRDVELRFHAPAEAYHLPRVEVPSGAEWARPVNDAVDRLNDVLFGPQEYAVVARTPPAAG
ncbi:MAG TPA: class I SAM-dependent methyltransferase [Acidimicrobiales bacterium]|nr:class I SAM-dependent methyltransferase [Acidimicrobiales bacterium]